MIKNYGGKINLYKNYKKCAFYYIYYASFAVYIEMLLKKDLKCNWCRLCADKK